MDFQGFNEKLAGALSSYSAAVWASGKELESFKGDPTDTVKEYLRSRGVTVPEMFHAHAIFAGDPLPAEPERATRDRFIYIYRKTGLFEFKIVPGSPTGNDSIMEKPTGACCCCNCCVIEL